jgi:hypothetical protein
MNNEQILFLFEGQKNKFKNLKSKIRIV